MGLLPKTESGSPNLNLTFCKLNIDNERPASKRVKVLVHLRTQCLSFEQLTFPYWMLVVQWCLLWSQSALHILHSSAYYRSDWALKSASLNLDIHFCNHTHLSIKSSLNLNLHFCKHTRLSIKEGSLFVTLGSPKPWCPHRTFDIVESGQWDRVHWSWFHNV
jgi:hypothetical protein